MVRNIFVVVLATLFCSGDALTTKSQDLAMKRGKVLYRASYSNTINTRTLAIFDGTFQYNGQETATTNNLGVTTIYDLEVEGKNWKNLWSTSSYNFPSSQLPSSFGEASLLMDTYHFTALDESTNALLGSLVFGATYLSESTGTVTGEGTVVFPVLGATGVYKRAKTVAITYNADLTRDVVIYKTQF